MQIKCETEKHEESGSIIDENGSTNQNPSGESEMSLSSTNQLIIGVVVVAVVLILLISFIIICKKRKRKSKLVWKIFQKLFVPNILGAEVNDIATNIQNHQWKQTPTTRPLPALPNAVQYNKKDRLSLDHKNNLMYKLGYKNW